MNKVVSYFYMFSGLLAPFMGGFLVLGALANWSYCDAWTVLAEYIRPHQPELAYSNCQHARYRLIFFVALHANRSGTFNTSYFLLEKLLLVLAAFLRELRTHLWLVGAAGPTIHGARMKVTSPGNFCALPSLCLRMR